VDAARVALRQKGVDSVTIYYRRTREEMPALAEEVDTAIEEGIHLETLVTLTRILSRGPHVSGIECVRNSLGSPDATGRRRPIARPGSGFSVPLDTLIVTIGDEPSIDYLRSTGIAITGEGRLRADPETLATSRAGVFAGGDVVTGPNTVVNAIAHGRRAATMIGRHLRGEPLKQAWPIQKPRVYVAPPEEQPGSREAAVSEAMRCLRCDLEFTAGARPI